MKYIDSIYMYFSCLIIKFFQIEQGILSSSILITCVSLSQSQVSTFSTASPFQTGQIAIVALYDQMPRLPQTSSWVQGIWKLKTDVCIIQFQGPSSCIHIPSSTP